MSKKQVTIKDIAKIAGVTTTTVSMAINNRPRISAKTRDRVLNIASELNYRPDLVARSLISKKSYSIGVIVNSITDPFFPELTSGIQEKANELGYSIIMCNTNHSLSVEGLQIERLRSKGVDGIICATCLMDDPHIKSLVEDEFPFVLVNRRHYDPELSQRIDSVVLNNYSGGYNMIVHFYRMGHDRIANLTGLLSASTGFERSQGVSQAMRDNGIRQDPRLTVECKFSYAKAYEATKKILEVKQRPTALFAHEDDMALGAREAILEGGLRIPEDIALAGFDDIRTSCLTGIELTTISQKKFEMGELCVKLLVDKLKQQAPPMANHIVLQDQLIVRKSCGFHLKGYVR